MNHTESEENRKAEQNGKIKTERIKKKNHSKENNIISPTQDKRNVNNASWVVFF